MKATREPGGQSTGDEVRPRLLERLGLDASVAGGGDTLVARYWVAASDAAAADANAREVLADALADVAGADHWTIVRAHHAVAHERAEEIYRGAADRAARPSAGGDR